MERISTSIKDEPVIDDVDAGVDDIDHYTCCDPAYYLATGRPIYAICGRRLRPDDVIKLESDGTPICATCQEVAAHGEQAEGDWCAVCCPRLIFG